MLGTLGQDCRYPPECLLHLQLQAMCPVTLQALSGSHYRFPSPFPGYLPSAGFPSCLSWSTCLGVLPQPSPCVFAPLHNRRLRSLCSEHK